MADTSTHYFLGLRLPRTIFDSIHTMTIAQDITAAEIALNVLIAVREKTLSEIELAKELQHHQDQLDRSQEA